MDISRQIMGTESVERTRDISAKIDFSVNRLYAKSSPKATALVDSIDSICKTSNDYFNAFHALCNS